MQDFAAIDFETANNERSSVCSVGVVNHRSSRAREFHPHPLTEHCTATSMPHATMPQTDYWLAEGLMPVPAHRHRETFSHLIGSYGYILYGRQPTLYIQMCTSWHTDRYLAPKMYLITSLYLLIFAKNQLESKIFTLFN